MNSGNWPAKKTNSLKTKKWRDMDCRAIYYLGSPVREMVCLL